MCNSPEGTEICEWSLGVVSKHFFYNVLGGNFRAKPASLEYQLQETQDWCFLFSCSAQLQLPPGCTFTQPEQFHPHQWSQHQSSLTAMWQPCTMTLALLPSTCVLPDEVCCFVGRWWNYTDHSWAIFIPDDPRQNRGNLILDSIELRSES